MKNIIKSVPFLVWIILFLQLAFVIVYFIKISNLEDFLLSIIPIALSFIMLFLYSYFFTLVNLFANPLRFILNFLFIFIFSFLLLFNYHEGTPLEFSIIWHYRSEILSDEMTNMLLANLGFNTKFVLIIIILFPIVLELKWKLISHQGNIKKRAIQTIVTLLLIVFVYQVPVKSFDAISKFNYSYVSFLRIQSIYPNDNEVTPYKYEKISIPNSDYVDSKKDMPNIFFIVVESLKDNVINKEYNGLEVTPYLNTLLNKGIYVENFYGNCVVTSRGQFSLIFSLIPSYSEKVFTNYENTDFKSLADILKDYNYNTIFYQGFNDINFDNTNNFLLKNGFDFCRSAKSINFLEETPYGGVHDFALYDRFYNLLDSLESRNTKEQKYFGVLATITSHRPYVSEFNTIALPYPKSEVIEERYLNSMRVADYSLELFIENLKARDYLKNSLIIIVGDHSVPLGEHHNYLNSVGAFEENFKTSLLILWDRLEPKIVKDTAWSQIDIAPTIIDLLGLEVKHHFIGNSILRKSENPVYLVQPYDGLIFSLINYPLKYVNEIDSGKEFLYNLENDPQEVHNIFNNKDHHNIIKYFRSQIKIFGENQYLLENNLIWHANK